MSDNINAIKVFIESKSASINFSDTHKIFMLQDPIEVTNPHIVTKVTLLDFETPISFYAINSTNNNIQGTINFLPFNIQLPVGNYDTNTIITELQSLFATFLSGTGITLTITYNSITNKYKFKLNSSFVISLSVTSSLLSTLGFSNTVTFSGNEIESDISVNLAHIKNIFFKVNNLTINNRFNGKTSKILNKIPVDGNAGDFIYYKNPNNIGVKIDNEHIDILDISLEDEVGNPLGGSQGLNGLFWSATLLFSFHTKTDYTRSNIRGHERLKEIEENGSL